MPNVLTDQGQHFTLKVWHRKVYTVVHKIQTSP